MAKGNIEVTIAIKKWCWPIINVFVFFGMYPPRWCFNISSPHGGDE